MNVSSKIKTILTAAVTKSNIGEIAAEVGLSVQAVTGSLATIKKENLATYENKKLVLTPAGLSAIGVTVTNKKKKNKEIVADLVAANRELLTSDKPALVNLIATTLNKSVIDSRVYLYNWSKANPV